MRAIRHVPQARGDEVQSRIQCRMHAIGRRIKVNEASILGLLFSVIRDIVAAAQGRTEVEEAVMRGIESVHDARAKAKFGAARIAQDGVPPLDAAHERVGA